MLKDKDPSGLKEALDDNACPWGLCMNNKLRALFQEKEDTGYLALAMDITRMLLDEDLDTATFILVGVLHEFVQQGRTDMAGNVLAELGWNVLKRARGLSDEAARKQTQWHLDVSERCSKQKTYQAVVRAIITAENDGSVVMLAREYKDYWDHKTSRFPYRRSAP